MMNKETIRDLIAAHVDCTTLDVRGDDGTHFEALVVATQFAGKRLLQRHQLVYATLGAAVGREIHALSIAAHTPEEWAARDGR